MPSKINKPVSRKFGHAEGSSKRVDFSGKKPRFGALDVSAFDGNSHVGSDNFTKNDQEISTRRLSTEPISSTEVNHQKTTNTCLNDIILLDCGLYSTHMMGKDTSKTHRKKINLINEAVFYFRVLRFFRKLFPKFLTANSQPNTSAKIAQEFANSWAGRWLHRQAAENNYADIESYMRKQNVDINSESQMNGYSPLILAGLNGHWDMVKTLLDAGAEVRRVGLHTEIDRVLSKAIVDKKINSNPEHIQIVLKLLIRCEEYINKLKEVNCPGIDCNAPLFCSADMKYRRENVKVLSTPSITAVRVDSNQPWLSREFDVFSRATNKIFRDGSLPMLKAVIGHRLSNMDDQDPSCRALMSNSLTEILFNSDTRGFFSKFGEESTKAQYTLGLKFKDGLQIVNHGARDWYGMTPLMRAVKNNNEAAVEIFLRDPGMELKYIKATKTKGHAHSALEMARDVGDQRIFRWLDFTIYNKEVLKSNMIYMYPLPPPPRQGQGPALAERPAPAEHPAPPQVRNPHDSPSNHPPRSDPSSFYSSVI